MYKYIALIITIFFCNVSFASDIKIIKFDNTPDTQERIWLLGTSNGAYIVKPSQFSMAKLWSGEGQPKISLSEAISTAKKHLKIRHKILLKNIDLRFAATAKSEIIWYYHITFNKAPYKFDQKKYEVIMLTSGEIVLSNQHK